MDYLLRSFNSWLIRDPINKKLNENCVNYFQKFFILLDTLANVDVSSDSDWENVQTYSWIKSIVSYLKEYIP